MNINKKKYIYIYNRTASLGESNPCNSFSLHWRLSATYEKHMPGLWESQMMRGQLISCVALVSTVTSYLRVSTHVNTPIRMRDFTNAPY